MKVLQKCKFVAKPDGWYEGEVELIGVPYLSQLPNDRMKDNNGKFNGIASEEYALTAGELEIGSSSFDRFNIYDEFGDEISEMTMEEWLIKKRQRIIEQL